MEQIFKKTKLLALLILAISFQGCEEDDEVLPQVIADFTYTLNEDSATIRFINTSEEATKYEWSFGDGTSSTEINPVKTYMETGSYKVVLKASNVSGASATFEDDISITIKEGIALPITFDNELVNYETTVFGGASFEIVPNPDESGSNSEASNVGAVTNGGAAFEGFFFDLVTPTDLTENKTIRMDFWSETAVDLLLKLAEGTGDDAEVTISHGGTGWEEVSFNFTTDASYSRYTFFVDPSGTTEGTFYIDDIQQVATPISESGCGETPVAAASLPLDFEGCDTFLSSENFGEGITSGLAANPSKTGINTSDFVLQVDKPTGSDFFAGVQNTFENNFDLTTTDTFKAKVYSTKANVVFRFELAVNPQTEPVTGNPAPVFVTVPNANEWTEIEFAFTGLPGGPTAYNQLVIKPDNGTDDPITEGGTYYIDDLTLGTAAGSGGSAGQGEIAEACAGSMLQDFETADNSIFGDFGGGTALIIDNPNTTVNTSAKVGQMQKFAAEPYGGTTMSLGAAADFSNGEVFTLDVYSQRAAALTFKLEGLNIEKVISTSGTGWETMTFDFTGQTGAADVNAITLIFDNGTNGDAAGDPDAWTFLFDNLRLCDTGGNGGGTGGGCSGELIAATALPLNFEGCETFLASQNFGAGLTSDLVPNPFKTGLNTSDFVLQVDKVAGADFFAGVQNTFPSNFDLTTTNTFKLKVYSTKANVVFRFELALNPQTDPVTGNPAPVFITIPNANEWTEVQFTFTGLPGGPTAYNQLVIKPDNDQTDSAISVSGTYYIDDLILE